MTKFVRRITAVAVIIATLLSLSLISSADTPKKTLVCIGDSIAAGFGLTEELSMDFQDANMERFLNSGLTFYGQNPETAEKDKEVPAYPRLVSDTLGYEYVNLTSSGMRAVDAYAMLCGEGYATDGILAADDMKAYTQNMQDAVKEASVVMLSVGINDVSMVPMYQAFKNSKSGEVSFVDAFLDANSTGHEVLLETLPKLIAKIRELNPDCEIQLLSLFNPLCNVSLTGLNEKALSSLDILIANLNLNYASIALKNKVTFIDITEVKNTFPENRLDISNISLNAFLAIPTHPDAEGHRVIADCILKKINTLLPQNGELVTYLGDTYVGELTYRKTVLGWTIQNIDGKYLNYDGEGNLTLSDRATVWNYDGGFYTYKQEKSPLFGFLGLKRTTRQYLTFDGENFGLSSAKNKATLYKV